MLVVLFCFTEFVRVFVIRFFVGIFGSGVLVFVFGCGCFCVLILGLGWGLGVICIVCLAGFFVLLFFFALAFSVFFS